MGEVLAKYITFTDDLGRKMFVDGNGFKLKVTYEIEKFSKDYSIDGRFDDYQKSLLTKLNDSAKSKSVITITDEYRGRGTTYALARFAEDNDLAFVIGAHFKKGYLTDTLGFKGSIVHVNNLRGRRFENGFIVDTDVQLDKIDRYVLDQLTTGVQSLPYKTNSI